MPSLVSKSASSMFREATTELPSFKFRTSEEMGSMTSRLCSRTCTNFSSSQRCSTLRTTTRRTDLSVTSHKHRQKNRKRLATIRLSTIKRIWKCYRSPGIWVAQPRMYSWISLIRYCQTRKNTVWYSSHPKSVSAIRWPLEFICLSPTWRAKDSRTLTNSTVSFTCSKCSSSASLRIHWARKSHRSWVSELPKEKIWLYRQSETREVYATASFWRIILSM